MDHRPVKRGRRGLTPSRWAQACRKPPPITPALMGVKRGRGQEPAAADSGPRGADQTSPPTEEAVLLALEIAEAVRLPPAMMFTV